MAAKKFLVPIDLGANPINNVGGPTSATDAARIEDVVGLAEHAPCFYAFAAAPPAYTYSNGTAGVGATITANAHGVWTVDGQTLTVGDRILLPSAYAAAGSDAGIYTVTTVGTASVYTVLTRAADFNTATAGVPGTIQYGAFVSVVRGTAYANTLWTMTQSAAITVGSTALTFTQVSGIPNIIVTADANAAAVATTDILAWSSLTAARTATLPAASSVPKGHCIEFIDFSGSASATNTLSGVPNGSDTIGGVNANAIVVNAPRGAGTVQSDGVSDWKLYTTSVGFASTTTYPTAGTYTQNINPNCTGIRMIVIGGGGGGGGGYKAAASAAATGGGGGAGGGYDDKVIPRATMVGTTLTIIVGAGGPNGTGGTTPSVGTIGGSSSVSDSSYTYAFAYGGNPGNVGTTTTAAGGTSTTPSPAGGIVANNAGGAGSATATGTAGTSASTTTPQCELPGGGGGGGGVTSGNAPKSGGAGGSASWNAYQNTAAPAGGTEPGGGPGTVLSPPSGTPFAASGGGGGSGNTGGGSASSGANGGTPGGGGGGGGGVNGSGSAGNGGTGGVGLVVVITW